MRTDDAQRELEQRALRNVRGLVDKMEKTDELEGRKQRKALVGLAIAALVIAIVAAIFISMRAERGKEVVIDPRQLPPLKGGPQK